VTWPQRVRGCLILALLPFLACQRARHGGGPRQESLPTGEDPWIEATLSRLSMREKVGQMVGVRAGAVVGRDEPGPAGRLRRQVGEAGVGLVCLFESDPEALRALLVDLQARARVPLLVAADLERGPAFRLRKGATPLPYAMAFGAVGRDQEAAFAGEVSAREARALGIQLAFAPVGDVNSNPDNPVINVRSFGEDPELVSRLSTAFIRGARAGGLATAVKHFPGHGDTAVDTHLGLAVLRSLRPQLEAVEMRPFRQAVQAGVDAVMTAHVAAPALDPTGVPATLSPPIVSFLRRDLGFDGLVITDALDMGGLARWGGEDLVLRAVEAGADVVLLPPDPDAAIETLVRAAQTGRVTMARIDESVRRILRLKARLSLHHPDAAPAGAGHLGLATPQDLRHTQDVARQSITVVKNDGFLLPLSPEAPGCILHLVLSSDRYNPALQGIPEAELARRGVRAETVRLGPSVAPEDLLLVEEKAKGCTAVLVSAFVRVTSAKGTADMAPTHAHLVRELVAEGHKVAVVSFGSPYLLRQFPKVAAYVAAYGYAESSQVAAIQAVLGEYPVRGHLPVTLPGLFARGHGIEVPARVIDLPTSSAEAAGFRPEAVRSLVALLERAIEARAFPGCALAVGLRGRPAYLGAFGRMTFDPGAEAVRPDTIFDLASLTKIVVTTTAAMILVDEGRLDLDRKVRDLYPGFRGGARDEVTVAQLLSHSSGLPAHLPLYQEIPTGDGYLERIAGLELQYPPGSRSEYSDLGIILLGAILEKVAGEPLDAFARRRVIEPLGMKDTAFLPAAVVRARIAPTEQDPWRGRLLRGEVHDENAFAMGGIAPHAGLFGTAGDLARFALMALGGGEWGQRRIVSAETLDRFARRAGVPGSTRALGWDTPAAEGADLRSSVPGDPNYSSAGSLLSSRAFGHTGFTGTSLWIDPVHGLYVILLTNRVHPDRRNQAIRAIRAQVADQVVRALAPL
jgi:beta-N-acetylhexosaminidase